MFGPAPSPVTPSPRARGTHSSFSGERLQTLFSRFSRLSRAAAIAALLIAGARPALADDAALAEAQTRFKEGLALADKAKFEEARVKFLQAYAVVKAASVTYNLAVAEQKSGHDVEALNHYRAFLAIGANDTRVSDAMRDRARTNVAELAKKVAQIAVEAPEGTRVVLDGALLESTRDPVAVLPGKHALEGTFAGRSRSESIEAKAGETANVTLTFPEPVAPVVVVAPPPAEPAAHRTTLGWVVPATLGVLGVAGIATGAVFALGSQSAKDDAVALRTQNPGLCANPASDLCAQYDDKRSSSDTKGTVATVGYIGGGALLAGAVATFVFWPKAKSARPERGLLVVPHADARGAGALLSGSF